MPRDKALDLEYQYRDMLAQQQQYKSEADVKKDEAATRKAGGGQFIQAAPISPAKSLKQKVKARRVK